MLDALQEANATTDYGTLKQFTMEMFSNAQCSDQFNTSPKQSHDNFYLFKVLYNMLLKLEMYEHPTMTGVNTF